MQRAEVNFKPGYLAPTSDFFFCETNASQEPDQKTNQLYQLDVSLLPTGFVDQHHSTLESGVSQICIPQAKANRTSRKIERPPHVTTAPKYLGEVDTQTPSTRRDLTSATGDHSVLVVIVTSTAGESDPTLNTTVVQGNVFGIGPSANPYNLVTHYGECSHYSINFVPASGNNVEYGVLTLLYNGTIAGSKILGSLQSDLLDATKATLGISNIQEAADHVMFCVPNGMGTRLEGLRVERRPWYAQVYTHEMVLYFYHRCPR